MKVLHCIHSLAGGGAETQLRILIANAHSDAVQHAVLCFDNKGIKQLGNCNYIFQCGNSTKSLRSWFTIWAYIKKHKPDILHVWLPASVTIPAMLSGRLLGIKVVFSYRSRMRFHRYLSYPEWLTALFCATRIVSNSEQNQSKPAFAKLFRWKDGVVIENAVSTNSVVWKGNDSSKFSILFAGRLVEGKNLDALIQACASLGNEIDFVCNVFGDGPLREHYFRLIEKSGLADRFILRGFSPDIFIHMASTDCFIFPSLCFI